MTDHKVMHTELYRERRKPLHRCCYYRVLFIHSLEEGLVLTLPFPTLSCVVSPLSISKGTLLVLPFWGWLSYKPSSQMRNFRHNLANAEDPGGSC